MAIDRVYGFECLLVTSVVNIVYRVFIFFISKFATLFKRRAP
jgi:hypothetical protein